MKILRIVSVILLIISYNNSFSIDDYIDNKYVDSMLNENKINDVLSYINTFNENKVKNKEYLYFYKSHLYYLINKFDSSIIYSNLALNFFDKNSPQYERIIFNKILCLSKLEMLMML